MANKDQKGLTVVTLCRNNPDQLELTLKSISCQTSPPSRTIVVDGSEALFRQEIETITHEHSAQYLFQTPSGIYDAMNRALVDLNPSESVLFLNSGDWFASPKSVEIINNVLREEPGLPWLVGDTLTIGSNGHKVGTRHRLPLPTRWGLRVRDFWFPHPSTIYRASVLQELGGYVTSFLIAADYLMSLKFFENHGPPHTIPQVLSVHHLDGISTQYPYRGPIERTRARLLIYGPIQIFLEPGILFIRFLRQLAPVLQRILPRWRLKAEELEVVGQRFEQGHFCKRPQQILWPRCCLDFLSKEIEFE